MQGGSSRQGATERVHASQGAREAHPRRAGGGKRGGPDDPGTASGPPSKRAGIG
jgi:hypothetical protein